VTEHSKDDFIEAYGRTDFDKIIWY